MEDKRFKKAFNDPRFRSIKKSKKKLEVDERFSGMFTEAKFKLETRIDKRGKPVFESTESNLKKFYRLPSKKNKKTKSDQENKQERLKVNDETEASDAEKVGETDEDEINANKEVEDLQLLKEEDSEDESELSSSEDEADPARGEGNIESSDFSDTEEFYNDEKPSEVFDHNWNDWDTSVHRSDDISYRLCLCNMDWDRVKAVDIFMLLNSFKPANGAIKSVSIYISEYGKERLEEEKRLGPKEIREQKENLENDDEKEDEKFHVETLRQYQLNRLKYYYAVVVCDSKQTADTIYCACDGNEFETSSSKLDLRFVPDDMTFDDEPAQMCDSMPGEGTYEPNRFVTTALNQSKVDLTWDETDKRRVSIMTKRFTEDELKEMDFKEFLASSSDEDDEDVVMETKSGLVTRISRTSTADQIERYKSLLMGELDEIEEKDEDEDIHMEVSWNPDPEDKDKKSGADAESTFHVDDKEVEDPLESDDEKAPRKEKKKNRAVKEEEEEEEETEETKKQKAELELLMMEDDEKDQKHFDMMKIMKNQEEKRKIQKKRRKKKQKTIKEDQVDDFKINLKDERFTSIFTSPDFAIDPNYSAFKKTDGMLKLAEEVRKNRLEGVQMIRKSSESNQKEITKHPADDVDLVSLIKSTNKTQKKKQKSFGSENKKVSDLSRVATDEDESGSLANSKEEDTNDGDETSDQKTDLKSFNSEETESKDEEETKKKQSSDVAHLVSLIKSQPKKKRKMKNDLGDVMKKIKM